MPRPLGLRHCVDDPSKHRAKRMQVVRISAPVTSRKKRTLAVEYRRIYIIDNRRFIRNDNCRS